MIKLIQGDCLDVLGDLAFVEGIEPNSIDALVTDPPAGISFMNKAWDDDKGGRKQWIAWMTSVMQSAYAAMKPGAHGLIWALPRTSHWTATALEDAGFEVRDVVTHLFGSGFPKSLNVSIAIDKAVGAVGARGKAFVTAGRGERVDIQDQNGKAMPTYKPATDSAKQWDGWGTALKPASEHWILVRKPLSEKTVAANVLKWGTGALNIDASRIGTRDATAYTAPDITGNAYNADNAKRPRKEITVPAQGRFPANLVLSHSPRCEEDQCDLECAVKMLDAQSIAGGMHGAGRARKGGAKQKNGGALFGVGNHADNGTRIGDTGGASRFFYCAKISSSERNAGLDGMPDKKTGFSDGARRAIERGEDAYDTDTGGGVNRIEVEKNHHPTVKSKKLMSYLIKMVTPPNGIVLDPFMGSGSTGVAAKECGLSFIGIERDADYFEIAKKRVGHAKILGQI